MNRGRIRNRRSQGATGDDDQERTRVEARKGCVLIVEDEPRVRELMVMLMHSEGFDVVELADGLEAMNYLAACEVYGDECRRPDLIIADIHMPEFSGLDLLVSLREHAIRPPVMLVTGVKDEEVHREGKRLGATCVICKPFDIDALLEAVDKSLASPRIPQQVEPEIATTYVDA